MSEIQVFNNAEFGSVRSLMVNGEPYFVGRTLQRSLVTATAGKHCLIMSMKMTKQMG